MSYDRHINPKKTKSIITNIPKLNELVKHDAGKPALTMLPTEALEEIAKVLEFGAKKYERNNWKRGTNWTRIADSLLRHLFAWLRGEDKDEESGISHLAHVGCNILFLIYFEKNKVGKDDR